MKTILISMLMLFAFALTACAQKPALTPALVSPAVEEDLDARGFVNSADGKLRVSGKGPFLLALNRMSNPPAAPAGWEFAGPVFDITARDRQQRPVRQFAAPLALRFDIAENRPLTILVHTESGWQVVPSEIDAEGKLTANVDHLTPYTIGAPASAGNARGSITRVPTITPGARVTVTAVPASSSDAASALKIAAEALKQKTVKITGAAGYTGGLYVAVPSVLQNALGSALGAGGTAYYGFYNAVNEVVTVNASGSRGATSGALSLLVEPKTAMPTSADDAKKQLAALFPGVTATLTQSQQSSFVFYGVSGNTAYSLGYVSYNGVPLAYAMMGTGSYMSLVPK
ncbi:MAG: hypothetical protein HY868_23370 [Chloroflexi bacterium]|nr:hypothetical protein [Chloroflexota bacterium]